MKTSLLFLILITNDIQFSISISMDASRVTWAHAVNSKKQLEDALKGDIMFLEADVVLGNVIGPNPENSVPIMAHPPTKESDISLKNWINRVIAAKTNKGVKLDFKFIEILKPSLEILKTVQSEITFPLWLNADILQGPIQADAKAVNSTQFLALCSQYFPEATLSVGWTTKVKFGMTGQYNWHHVKEMAEVLHCAEISQPVTFPVRAAFVGSSIDQLLWLLDIFPNSTLTVWSGVFDLVSVDGLLQLRSRASFAHIYYDLPPSLFKQFVEKKQTVLPASNLLNFKDHSYVLIGDEESCSDKTYISSSAILFSSGRRGLIFTEIIHPTSKIHFSGRISFPNSDKMESSLQIILCNSANFPSDSSSSKHISPDVSVNIFDLLQKSNVVSYSFDSSKVESHFELDISGQKGLIKRWTASDSSDHTADHFNLQKSIIISIISNGELSIVYNASLSIFPKSSAHVAIANMCSVLAIVFMNLISKF